LSQPPADHQRKRKGISGYEPGCEPEVYDFQRRCYPDREPEGILPRWTWLFLDSARRLGIEPMVWMYRKDGRVVAHQGALPVRLRVRAESLVTGWFIETMAAEEIRGSPIGPMLIQKALGDLPLNLSLGQTEQMRELQYALGWKKVVDLNTYVFVCSLRIDLRHRLPPVLSEMAALAVGLPQAVRLKAHAKANPLPVRELERFDASHDTLWQRMAPTVTCAVVRDASYLNWKYVDRPGANFIRLEFGTKGAPSAVAVVMLVPPGHGTSYSRGFVVDLVGPFDDLAWLSGVLAGCIEHLKRRGARTVTFHAAHPGLERALTSFGFFARGPRHVLLVSTKGQDALLADDLLAAENWYLTLGDSDADAFPG
jgi:hypothetical protein